VVANAFSVSMISVYPKATLSFVGISLEDARKWVKLAVSEGKLHSIVGHESTAKLLSELLGAEIKANREFYIMRPNDVLLVASINARLPEGKVLNLEELKKFADSISWRLVILDSYFV